MAKCTVAGERDLPGLPTEELQRALYVQFPEFWRAPHEFEPLWKTSVDAVGQAYKRLRAKQVVMLT